MIRSEIQADVADRLGDGIEARWIVQEVLGAAVPPGAVVGDEARAAIGRLTDRRAGGEPLQYAFGHWAFRSLDLLVDPRVLIPRPETEHVVDVALGELARVVGGRSDAVVVDLGTGSGAIALSISLEACPGHPHLAVWATDVDRDALQVAVANRQRVGAVDAGAAERVRLRRGCWWRALPEELRGRVDLVVSNPPYVTEEEWRMLDEEVRHEPRRALVAAPGRDGGPGLAGIEAVVSGAARWLAPQGAAVVEIAPQQREGAVQVARGRGFTRVTVEPDLAGRPRALVASR